MTGLKMMAAALLLSGAPALAMRPVSELQAYPFEKLTLVKIAGAGTHRSACFAKPDGGIVWTTKGYYLSEFGRITEVARHRVTVEQMVMVNGGEFALSILTWPVAQTGKPLAEKCGAPPPR